MPAPRRFKDGVTNVGKDSPFSMLGMLDPTKYSVCFEDFVYDKSDIDGYSSVTAANDTIAMVTGQGGILALTISGKDDNVADFQRTTMDTFLVSGKKAWIGCRVKVNLSAVTKEDWFFGVSLTDTAPIASTPADAVYILKPDGVATVNLVVIKNGAASRASAVCTNTTSTWEKYDIYFDGVDEFQLYQNDVYVGMVETTAFPTDGMGLHVAVQAGAATKLCNLWIDYMYAIVER